MHRLTILSLATGLAFATVFSEQKTNLEFLKSQIDKVEYTQLTGTLTHCAITLKNGFVVTGESSCVDEKQFNEEIGQKIAYDNAFEKLWQLYGFWLKQELYTDKVMKSIDENAEPYQLTEDTRFGFDLASALAESGSTVQRESTGLTITAEDAQAFDWKEV